MKKDERSAQAYFRQRAEELLKKELLAADFERFDTETQRLIQELRLHQIELELQHDELRHAWARAEVASEKYQELYDFAPAGFVTLSREGEILDINLCGSELLCRERSRLKKTMFDLFISHNTGPVFKRFLEQVFTGQAKETCEITLTPSGSAPKFVHLTGIAAKNGDYCVVTIVDFTGRLKIENELRESEEKYRRYFEHATYGIFQSTPEGRAISVNPAFAAMFGYDSIEDALKNIINVSEDVFVDPARRKEIIRLLKENPDIKSFENQYKRKDGSSFTGILNILPVYDQQGRLVYLEGFIEDITVRRQAQQALLESESKYRGLVENSPDAIAIYIEGKIVFVNKESIKLMGAATAEDLIGRSVLQFVHPESRALVIKRMKEVAVVGVVLPLTEEKFIRLDGFEVEVEVKAMSIIFDDQPAVQLIIRDITGRKKAERELRLLNDSLEERVAERTGQLKKANKDLELYINEIEQFTYIVSHDLQEPLRTLNNFADLLLEEYRGKLDDDGSRYIQFISGAATQMSELVKGLLLYSLLGKNSVWSLVDCNQVVKEVLTEMAGQINECDAKITVGELPVINGCFAELKVLFRNLISNSIKFRRKEVAPEISISVWNLDHNWLFSVKDNGIGLDKKDQEKIFIIFKRLHNRDEFEGSGIGLAHCKKVVELHGGRIWVETSNQAGTVVNFTIPLT